MKKYKELLKLKYTEFKLLVRVKKEAVAEMIEVLEAKYSKNYINGDRNSKLLIEN